MSSITLAELLDITVSLNKIPRTLHQLNIDVEKIIHHITTSEIGNIEVTSYADYCKIMDTVVMEALKYFMDPEEYELLVKYKHYIDCIINDVFQLIALTQ